MSLAELASGLLHEALRVYAASPRAAGRLRQQLDRFDEPLRVAVAGPPGSGKSTLVAALAGDRPSRAMRHVAFVEAPGDAPVASVCADADGVLYLLRGRDGRALAALATAFEHPVAAIAPVAVIAVLARADELGGGRIDALSSGKRMARRYRRDPEVHAMCQDVVAVAGLLAHAARILGQPEFDALAALARLPRDELSAALLSADRFVRAATAELPPDARQGLLDRVGVFGVRLITTLIRSGVDDPARLQAELVQRSGLGELRESIRRFFLDRRDVLKARSALLTLDTVLRAEPRPEAAGLVAELERVLAGAHDLRELRLLAALQAGRTGLPDTLSDEAGRIAGGHGTGVLERLGIERPEPEAELRQIMLDALDRWQAHAGDPRAAAEARRAAAVVVRSCEGMLGALRGAL